LVRNMKKIDYSLFEKSKDFIPEGMKVIGWHPGVFENALWLLGLEGISYLLYDNPALVKDTIDQVAIRLINYFDNIASFEIVGAIVVGEDMGFKTHTTLSPDIYKKYIFPWHKEIINTAHKHGKPVFLHSCGNVSAIIEDIIACGWDARHAFEDIIEPVWEAKKTHGARIALLGGFDMDKLCRMNTEEVRSHTRFLINECSPGGKWALGTGNSVANYIKLENFFAMIEEGFQYRL
ncbi:MAG: uroporphyrinogen-III decarboxylase-like protein, partial [Actinobacteria bacterium]|nr:uroporphyrinogen-III decarboxylase-like protein [Actinomycetota bacterium]